MRAENQESTGIDLEEGTLEHRGSSIRTGVTSPNPHVVRGQVAVVPDGAGVGWVHECQDEYDEHQSGGWHDISTNLESAHSRKNWRSIFLLLSAGAQRLHLSRDKCVIRQPG